MEIIRNKACSIPAALQAEFPAVLARLYASRGVLAVEELDYNLNGLPNWRLLKGADLAASLLADAMAADQRILIIGDYDADGATSTAVAVRALSAMGGDADFLLPNRFTYGYGLTPEIVAVAMARSPDVLVTVDNGIASLDGVTAARAGGLTVIITDHHLPGHQLPNAHAIVNPNQPDDHFPSRSLAGVGVVFYLMLALRAQLRERGWFVDKGMSEPNLAGLLDLVALGTVADVVPLDHLNRTLVEQGLRRIRAGKACAGIQALLEVAGRDASSLKASDLGFALGPRLNAAGRLEDMSLGVACLLTDKMDLARSIALQLQELNQERRAIESEMRLDASAVLDQMMGDHGLSALPWGLCLYEPGWHQGVIGILASRVREAVHRPTIVFADAANGELKGSARSVPGLHIRDVLDTVATLHPGLIDRFGGHAMAAGLSLQYSHFSEFCRVFDEVVRGLLSADELRGVLHSDGELMPDEFTLEMAQTLQFAGPWGQGFSEPLFDGEFTLIDRRIVGEHHLKMTVIPMGACCAIDAIAFQTTDQHWPNCVKKIRMAYQLDVNQFRGASRLQILVRHVEPLAFEPA